MTGFIDAQDFLFSLRNTGSKYGIERVERWAQLLGNPQDQVSCIHIAGTNGKGSTCALIESVFREAGYRTGMFTSPHLLYLGERVQVNRMPINKEVLLRYIEQLKVSAYQLEEEGYDHPSFFEYITMLAFLYFKDQEVDVAIIETGLGGRLDSTNIIKRPLATAITSISFDHMHILGSTIPAIAGEKAGIIKRGCPVVIGDLPLEADKVVMEKTLVEKAPLYRITEIFGYDIKAYPETNLHGKYQRKNAAIAVGICELLKNRFTLTDAVIEKGLHSVNWRGRWERIILANGHELILDAAHNEEGIRMLVQGLEELGSHDLTFIIGSLDVERAKALLEGIAPFAKKIIFVSPKQERALSAERLAALMPSIFSGVVEWSTVETLFPCHAVCCKSSEQTPTIITGSLYLLGEALERLEGLESVFGAVFQDKM